MAKMAAEGDVESGEQFLKTFGATTMLQRVARPEEVGPHALPWPIPGFQARVAIKAWIAVRNTVTAVVADRPRHSLVGLRRF